MLKPSYTKQFQKDLHRMLKRGKKPEKIKHVMLTLLSETPLDKRFKDHQLIGNYKDRRECHIEADWLLIYKAHEDKIIFERTGTHSDLFK